MKKLLVTITTIGLALPSPVLAEVDANIHKLCIEAKDYQGCVNAMTGEPRSPQTVIQENFDAGKRASGNSCPHTYAYAGAGWCRQVICSWSLGFGKHDPSLAGKGMKCPGGQTLGWVHDSGVRATIDPNCPDKPLEIGYQSTCQLSNGLSVNTWDLKWDQPSLLKTD